MAARKLTKERRLAVCQRRASYCYGFQMSPNKIADRLTCVYLKELASLVQAHDLEKKIEAESQIREKAQTMFSRSAALGDSKFYESAKESFVSDQRMTAYKEELNRRRSRDSNDSPKQALLPSPAKLAVSGLRIPLSWKDKDHFQNRGDSRRFALFAVFRIGAEIRDTRLLFNVDRMWTDITFDDVRVFEEVSFNFVLHISVYSCLLDDVQSAGSLRLKQKLRTSLPRSWNSKFGVSLQKRIIENAKFDLIATSTLTVRDADGPSRAFDLKLRNMGDSVDSPPLFDNFCCNLVLQPTSVLKPLREGVVTIQTPEITLQRVYCRLKNSHLNAWQKQEDVIFNRPILSILLPENTTVEQSRRKNSLVFSLPQQNRFKQCSISVSSEEEIVNWKNAFDQQLLDHKLWGKFAELEMPLFASISTAYQNFGGKTLYEQVLLDTSDASRSSYDRKTGRYFKQPTTKFRSAETVNSQKPVSHSKQTFVPPSSNSTFVSYINGNYEIKSNTTLDDERSEDTERSQKRVARSNSSLVAFQNVTVRRPLYDKNDRESEL